MEQINLNITNVFGSNVRRYRLLSNISQEKLADLCDLHRTYISDIERSQRNVSLESVEKIANALKIPAYKLFMEED